MKKGLKLDKLITFIFSLLIVSVVAFIGGLFTKIDAWYYAVRPSITPPTWVFPIAWNILFFMIALSLYFAWTKSSKNKKGQIVVLWVFGINFVFNILWSLFYFTMHNPLLAFLDIILLLASIVVMILAVRKFSRISAVLLIPYLLWVMFASLLNLLSI